VGLPAGSACVCLEALRCSSSLLLNWHAGQTASAREPAMSPHPVGAELPDVGRLSPRDVAVELVEDVRVRRGHRGHCGATQAENKSPTSDRRLDSAFNCVSIASIPASESVQTPAQSTRSSAASSGIRPDPRRIALSPFAPVATSPRAAVLSLTIHLASAPFFPSQVAITPSVIP
jgi:hypothetical protein